MTTPSVPLPKPRPCAADADALDSASQSPAGEADSTTTKKTCKLVAIVITVKRKHTDADAEATMGDIDVRREGDAKPAVTGVSMEQPDGTRDLGEGAGMKHYPVPAGTYKGVMISSEKNHKLSPHKNAAVEVLIPGWDKVLIHVGNYPKDSAGCILPGTSDVVTPVKNKQGKVVSYNGMVEGSVSKTQEIYNFIYDVKDKENGGVMPKITVIIKDP